ncbi:MAG: hypothetical protein Q8L93_05920 [Rhodocyclaceae bacterium]|nr:hypothetical protein [Rhodocyclaceae bacterium]
MPRYFRFIALLFSLLVGHAFAQEMTPPEAFEAARAGKIILIDIRTRPSGSKPASPRAPRSST